MPEISSALKKKSIHELRNIASGYGVSDVFSKTPDALAKAITIKQARMQPKPNDPPPARAEYDSRLMTRRPAKTTSQEEAIELLEAHINRGIVLTFPEPDRWHMRIMEREDTGTLRMPPRVLLDCADRMLK